IKYAPVVAEEGFGIVCRGDAAAAGKGLVPGDGAIFSEEIFDFALEEARAGFVDDVAFAGEAGGQGADEVGEERVVLHTAEDGVAGGVGAFVAVEGVDGFEEGLDG